MRFFRRTRKPPSRRWFRAEDGTYYRNCPLIKAEQDEVLAWPYGTRGKPEAFDALAAEWYRTYQAGVQRKAALDPGDVEVTPAPFREAYPRNPGLWALDELEARQR